MEDFSKLIFVNEVEKQCKFALISIKELEIALKDTNSENHAYNNTKVFLLLQSFLNATANLSKLFQPDKTDKRLTPDEKKGAIEREIYLQNAFGLNPNNPIFNRKARNNLEHFDTRLQTWCEKTTRSNFMDSNIGPINMVRGIDDIDRFRHFDPTSVVFYFWGEDYPIIPIVRSIEKIYNKALELNNPQG